MAITASTWTPLGNIALSQAINETSTTQQYPTGFRVQCKDTGSTNRGVGEFMYAKGVASVVAGDVCAISAGGDAAVRTVARTKGPLGLAMAAIVANNWGWFQIFGRGIATVAANFGDGETCWLTGTAATIDDSTSVTAGDVVYGCISAGAVDTGQALVDLAYPHAQDTDNS